MDFSLSVLYARLLLGAVSLVAGGAACVAIARCIRPAIYLLVLLLLALFVPVHASLWVKFAAWYHLVFVGSLVTLAIVGAKLSGPRGARAA